MNSEVTEGHIRSHLGLKIHYFFDTQPSPDSFTLFEAAPESYYLELYIFDQRSLSFLIIIIQLMKLKVSTN